MTASDDIANRLQRKKGTGQPLPPDIQMQMGQALGNDFSEVNIHTDSEAVQLSEDLNARAFTHGQDVYFNQGEYDPNSQGGRRLLGHELVHVGQQGGSDRNGSKR